MALNSSRLRPYLQLMRLPNAVTAVADVTAGMMLAGASWHDWSRWCWLSAASCCLYAGGAALNDVCDHAQDRATRPERPIPSGQISRTAGAALSTALLLVGVGLAMQCSRLAGLLAASLMLAIVFYDATFKKARFAPAIMGACRALNLALGMCAIHTPVFHTPIVVSLLLMWLYVSSTTYFARRESHGGSKKQLMLGTAGVVAAVVGVLWIRPFTGSGRTAFLVIIAVVVAYLSTLGTRAVTERTPERVQHAVGRFVLGIVVLDALLTWTVRGPWWALLVLVWLIPSVALSRRFRVT